MFHRIVICFVETSAKVGNYHKNPFNLRRKWLVAASTTIDSVERPFSAREQYLEQRLAQIESQFKAFQDNFTIDKKGKGKGRGKKSQKTNEDIQSQIQKEAEKRLRDFLNAQSLPNNEDVFQPCTSREALLRNVNSRISDDAWTNDSSSLQHFPTAATKPIFIRKLELTINGTPIDQVTYLFTNKLL